MRHWKPLLIALAVLLLNPAMQAAGSLRSGTCVANDSWTSTSLTGAPSPRTGATAVWTGEWVLVWGGDDLDSGGRYDPALDVWLPIALTGAPTGRSDHTAVWTGSRMIVWGGNSAGGYLNDGASYDPVTDTWAPLSVVDLPSARAGHSAVWTGDKMIVWGGLNEESGGIGSFCDPFLCCGDYLSDGAQYDPSTDQWTAIDELSAPQAAAGHVAVWTGSEMVVWTGRYNDQHPFSCDDSLNWTFTGGRYNPANDSWTGILAPQYGRPDASAVWDGSAMLVWGGPDAAGVRYFPQGDTWGVLQPADSPEGRDGATAVWSGSRLLAWGGRPEAFGGGPFQTGARYAPGFDTWTPMTTVGAPSPRRDHVSVWTDHGMFVWGATADSTGGIYDPGGADDDNDGMPESCDPCPADPVNDPDGDAICSAIDNCPSLANPEQADADFDQRGDLCDNCPDLFNQNQDDIDLDGAGDFCDCLPGDPSARSVPSEAFGLRWTEVELQWDSSAADYGDGTRYDLVRGNLAEFPIGNGASEGCLLSGTASLTFDATEVPDQGEAFYYVVRPVNACGIGNYGEQSSGGLRVTGACP